MLRNRSGYPHRACPLEKPTDTCWSPRYHKGHALLCRLSASSLGLPMAVAILEALSEAQSGCSNVAMTSTGACPLYEWATGFGCIGVALQSWGSGTGILSIRRTCIPLSFRGSPALQVLSQFMCEGRRERGVCEITQRKSHLEKGELGEERGEGTGQRDGQGHRPGICVLFWVWWETIKRFYVGNDGLWLTDTF